MLDKIRRIIFDQIRVYNLCSFPRCGETMLLKTFFFHPSVLIAGDISFDHYENFKLMELIKTKELNFISKKNTKLINKNHKICVVKQGTWCPQTKFDGFVLIRNPIYVLASLINLYEKIFSINEQDSIDILNSNKPFYSKLINEDYELRNLIDLNHLQHLKSSLLRWYYGFSKNKVDFEISIIDLFILAFNFRFSKLLNQRTFEFIKYEDIVLNPEKSIEKICKILKIKFVSGLSQQTIKIKQAHGLNDLSKPIYASKAVKPAIELPKWIENKIKNNITEFKYLGY